MDFLGKITKKYMATAVKKKYKGVDELVKLLRLLGLPQVLVMDKADERLIKNLGLDESDDARFKLQDKICSYPISISFGLHDFLAKELPAALKTKPKSFEYDGGEMFYFYKFEPKELKNVIDEYISKVT